MASRGIVSACSFDPPHLISTTDQVLNLTTKMFEERRSDHFITRCIQQDVHSITEGYVPCLDKQRFEDQSHDKAIDDFCNRSSDPEAFKQRENLKSTIC